MNGSAQFASNLVYYGGAATLMALLVSVGHRAYHKHYLRRWSLTWLIAGLLDVLVFLTSGPIRIGPMVLAVYIVGVATISWGLLSNGFEMALRRPLPLVTSRRMFGAMAAAVAVCAAVVLLIGGVSWRGLAAVASFFAGGCSVAISVLLIWERRRRLAPGFLVCAGALALFGLAGLGDAFRFGAQLSASWMFAVTLFSIVFAGCSILLFAVEDDREAALLAATQIEHIAYHDPLTGLPNRSMLLDRLIEITSGSGEDAHVAILFIDIDRLKEVNDTLGHATGDIVIRTMARRIRDAVRLSDTAARFAGDEFVVILENLQSPDHASGVAEKINASLQVPIISGSHEIHSSGTIGIAIYPDHGVTADELIRKADSAMYRAKTEGRNRFHIYEPEYAATDRNPAEMEKALRRAIDQKDLSLLYQPIVQLSTGEICGVEVLARWEDAVLGPVPTAEMIQVAESTQLIGSLGELVLHQACRDAVNWVATAGLPLFLSINLSPEQFADPELVSRIRRAVTRSGIDPGRLVFEVSESTILDDSRLSRRVVGELRKAKVRVAVARFGAGPSSLSELAALPVTALKLDRSIIAADESSRTAAVLSASVAVAKRLGLEVIAEGIETAEQLEIVTREDCELGQGFFLGRPVPSAELELRLEGRPDEAVPVIPEVDTDAGEAQRDLDDDVTFVSRQIGTKRARAIKNLPVSVIADDDARMRSLFATLLRRSGHEVAFAEDGLKAVALLEALDPRQVQLVILDLMMPRMSGWEVLERIAAEIPEILPRILIVTAAGADQINRIDPNLYGATLEKPFDQADFYDAVNRCTRSVAFDEGESDELEGPWH